MMPSTERPRACWNERTALSVCDPNTPSAAMPYPCWRSRYCAEVTFGPDDPLDSVGHAGSAYAVWARPSEITIDAIRPTRAWRARRCEFFTRRDVTLLDPHGDSGQTVA